MTPHFLPLKGCFLASIFEVFSVGLPSAITVCISCSICYSGKKRRI